MAVDPPKVIHAFVALCDNATQGIIKVSPKIGNGDDLDNNLYWGCDDGLRSYFKRSKQWRLVESRKEAATAVILERCVFKHSERDAWLVAYAYRGAEMRRALEEFLKAVSGAPGGAITVKYAGREITLADAGHADFLAFIGHNGLMDFSLPFPNKQRHGRPVPAAVLCCMSDSYFTAGLRQSGAEPVLMTRQLMYPGSFLLHAALEGWFHGGGPPLILDRAARAYAANQGIGVKAARGVFVAPSVDKAAVRD